MVVRVAKRYHQRRLNFCVITFYDPQRAAITKALEAAMIPSECVYNVDSFQGMFHFSHVAFASLIFRPPPQPSSGNEADYIVLSSVRTRQPGFLKSLPRMNVALTRCRKGMVIVTNKGFLQGSGKSTLLGKLCRFWSLKREAWLDWRTMLGTEVELPGIPTHVSTPTLPHNTKTE